MRRGFAFFHCPQIRTLASELVADRWQHDAAIYRRGDLKPGMTFVGPAIVEQDDATTVVEPGMTTRVDAVGNLLVELSGETTA